MSKFTLPSISTSATSTPGYQRSSYSDSDDDLDTLPYPRDLARNDFLAPEFDPQTYLSTLRNRHQTLEDLRSDLRARSQLLNQELLDLVNGNYEEFLSLGGDLKGGEEKVEGVRVGLLAFRRELEGVKKGVRERADEVAALVGERKAIRRHVALGRHLLEVSERIGELEESLGIKDEDDDEGDELDELDEEADEDEDETTSSRTAGIPIPKLQRHAQNYRLITSIIHRIGAEHPFLLGQASKLEEISRTILLDLASALRQARTAKVPEAILAIIKIYADLGAEEESVRVLKVG